MSIWTPKFLSRWHCAFPADSTDCRWFRREIGVRANYHSISSRHMTPSYLYRWWSDTWQCRVGQNLYRKIYTVLLCGPDRGESKRARLYENIQYNNARKCLACSRYSLQMLSLFWLTEFRFQPLTCGHSEKKRASETSAARSPPDQSSFTATFMVLPEKSALEFVSHFTAIWTCNFRVHSLHTIASLPNDRERK